jgi:hypothetical protein
MATLRNMTRVGADVRQIARLLQAKAPENHMLAYITPEEAQLLKDRGGSGMPDPETGVPSFAPAYDYGAGYGNSYTQQEIEPSTEPVQVRTDFPSVTNVDISAPVGQSETSQGQFAVPTGVNLYGSSSQLPTYDRQSTFSDIIPTPTYTGDMSQFAGAFPVGTLDRAPGPSGPVYQIDTSRPAADKGVMERLSEATGMGKESLARLGLAGIQAIIGAQASRKAAEQGQRGRAETQALAAPYQAKGAELQRQAQAGELTPVARQQLQAIQAQVAQSASARGGVGAQQSAARVEAIRNQLLQQQNDYGMKLTSIGDQITLGAIRTGLQADQYANQLTSSYFNNIMRTLAGTPTVTQTTQTTTTGA